MHDLIIRGGTLVDGTGAPPREADVAVADGLIVDVGDVSGKAKEEVQANGLLVTPGFVDIHTHYDGQITWDQRLVPSCWHGVTTAIIGNCGVGFAPAAPDRRDWLIGLMEGVEDIPGTALAEGINWNWESFPEYLDHLASLRYAMDIGTHVPHGPVRAYVMGERGAKNEPATTDDIIRMAAIVKEGVAAGALGFSMSRTPGHRAMDGEPVPGTWAEEAEILGLAGVLGELGTGLIELAPYGVVGEDLGAPESEMRWMREISIRTGRPITYAFVQHDADPTLWKRQLEAAEAAAADGARVYPQTHARSPSAIIGLESKFHPFSFAPTYLRELAELPLAERVTAMQRTEVREKLLGEAQGGTANPMASMLQFTKLFPLDDPPNYEPTRDESVDEVARRAGQSPWDVCYDILLSKGGKGMLMMPFLNYSDFNHDAVLEMLRHPQSALGLGDGGAHCGITCDASGPTHMIAYWARDRKGEKLPIEFAVKKTTSDTAGLYGLMDRGVVRPGMKADFNVIDFDRINMRIPEIVKDLPAGGQRLVQRAMGYVATIVSGVIVSQEGEDTGARPGRLIRGEQAGPA